MVLYNFELSHEDIPRELINLNALPLSVLLMRFTGLWQAGVLLQRVSWGPGEHCVTPRTLHHLYYICVITRQLPAHVHPSNTITINISAFSLCLCTCMIKRHKRTKRQESHACIWNRTVGKTQALPPSADIDTQTALPLGPPRPGELSTSCHTQTASSLTNVTLQTPPDTALPPINAHRHLELSKEKISRTD